MANGELVAPGWTLLMGAQAKGYDLNILTPPTGQALQIHQIAVIGSGALDGSIGGINPGDIVVTLYSFPSLAAGVLGVSGTLDALVLAPNVPIHLDTLLCAAGSTTGYWVQYKVI